MDRFFKTFSPVFSSLFENLQDSVSILEDGVFTYCNYATLKMLGMKNKDELIGKTPWHISPVFQPGDLDSKEQAQKQLLKCLENGSNRFQWTHIHSDGSLFFAEVLLTRFSSTDENTIFVLWRDITETCFIREQLKQTQKMEAIGQLASGLAHDFGNMISGIVGSAELLSNFVHGDPEAEGHIKRIKEASMQALNMTRGLLDFSRKSKGELVAFDVNELIAKTLDLASPSINKKIKITKDFKIVNPVIKGDPDQLQNALINLIFNARDAMKDGGKLELTTSEYFISSDIVNPMLLNPGNYIKVTVKDNGVGISEDLQQKVFDPFFTTKKVGTGTGLGLTSVFKALKDHHGTVSLKSKPGDGTEFDLFLPFNKSRSK